MRDRYFRERLVFSGLMSEGFYRLNIRKEALKFSAAHMTVFPDGSKESLHGHNYSTELSIELKNSSLEKMVSFSFFKGILEGICRDWDEKVLLAKNCPFFRIISQSNQEIEFTLCNKRYVLPADEIVLLEIENITSENLAKEACLRFLKGLELSWSSQTVLTLQMKIEETLGQGATFVWQAPT